MSISQAAAKHTCVEEEVSRAGLGITGASAAQRWWHCAAIKLEGFKDEKLTKGSKIPSHKCHHSGIVVE